MYTHVVIFFLNMLILVNLLLLAAFERWFASCFAKCSGAGPFLVGNGAFLTQLTCPVHKNRYFSRCQLTLGELLFLTAN